MAAIPNRLLPSESPRPTRVAPSRKPAARAASPKREKCKARTREEIDAEFRAGSEYQRWTGWTPLPRVFASDTFRLASGKVFYALRDYLIEQMGRKRAAGEKLVAEDVQIFKPEVAILLGAEERSINRELDYMVKRELAIVQHLEGGYSLVRLVFCPEEIGGKKYPGWSKVAEVSYEEWAAARAAEETVSAAEDDSADDTEEDATKVKAGTVPLTKAPVVVRGGHRSRSLPVKCGVKSTGVIWDSPGVDVQFTAVVESGELLWRGKLNAEKTVESNVHAKRADSTTSHQSRGHIRPENAKSPANAGSVKHPHSGVTNPRAAELASIFDPLVFGHCKKTLSGDEKSLQLAAIAIGETPHDDVVKAAVERAARPIRRPSDCVAICKEIEHNWRAGKSMPAAKGNGNAVDPARIKPWDPEWFKKAPKK